MMNKRVITVELQVGESVTIEWPFDYIIRLKADETSKNTGL